MLTLTACQVATRSPVAGPGRTPHPSFAGTAVARAFHRFAKVRRDCLGPASVQLGAGILHRLGPHRHLRRQVGSEGVGRQVGRVGALLHHAGADVGGF